MSLAASPDLVARVCHPSVGAGPSANAPHTAESTARRYVVVPLAERAHGQHYRTKRQHTTHLEGYPAEVTVVRARHPLEGQALPLLGWMRRHGKLDLILVLPDGSRTLIPAAWTDLDPSTQPEVATPASFSPPQPGRMMGPSATWKVPMHNQQLALDLGETPAPALLLWELLPTEHRLVAVAALARVIAQAAAVRGEDQPDGRANQHPVA